MRRKDFLPWLEQHSQKLVDHAQRLANQYGRPYVYHQAKLRKEKFVQDVIRRDRLDLGLVVVLCVQETCRTVKLRYDKQKPRLVFARRPERVLYYYWLDANFGVRLERGRRPRPNWKSEIPISKSQTNSKSKTENLSCRQNGRGRAPSRFSSAACHCVLPSSLPPFPFSLVCT